MKPFFICLAVIALMGSWAPSSLALAHDTVTYEALGGEPLILPTSPFYFLKELRRGILRTFAFGAERKASVELSIAEERLGEIKKLTEEKPEAQEALQDAEIRYRENFEALKTHIDSLSDKNKNTEKIIKKLGEIAGKHQLVFDEVKEAAKSLDKDLKEVERAVSEALNEAAKFDKETAKNAFRDLRGFIDELDDDLDRDLDETGLFDDIDDAFKELRELYESAKDNGKAERYRECGPMPLRPVPQGCSGPVCKEGKWEFVCPRPIPCPDIRIPTCEENKASEACRTEAKVLAAKYPRCGYEDYFSGVRPLPIACTENWSPVCGADGKTYSNECFAGLAHVAVKYKGECKSSNAGTGPCNGLPLPELAAPPAGCRYEGDQCSPKLVCEEKREETSAPVKVQTVVKGFAFEKEIRVPLGGTVVWTNADSVGHTVTADGNLFASNLLSEGSSFSFTFTKPGKFTYFCKPHPWMTGVVIVE